MKYSNEQKVEAQYTEPKGNPFLEALPELMSKPTFMEHMKSDIYLPYNLRDKNPQERRTYLTELTRWFYPMDYMYTIYDELYQAIMITYKTKATIEYTRQINQIHTNFRTGRESSLLFATQAYSGAILGIPGIGKTSTIRRCIEIIPQVIEHREYQGQSCYMKQINHLLIECPGDCSIKTLTYNIFAGIDKAIDSQYLVNESTLRSLSASALTAKLKIICMTHHIGLIIIDEIQNAIITATRDKQVKPLIKFLVELTNETSTSICFCGTLDAEDVFIKQDHLKRRTRGLRLLPMKYDITYRKFITNLWNFQVTLHNTILTEKLMKQIYDLTNGIPAYIIKIFAEAQKQAVLNGKEILSYDLIKQAVTYLSIDIPKSYNRGGISISDFEIQEIQFENIDDEYYDNLEKTVEETFIEPILGVEAGKYDKQEETPNTEPIKRFYATRRGRPTEQREQTDLMFLFKKDPEKFINNLELFNILERRCF